MRAKELLKLYEDGRSNSTTTTSQQQAPSSYRGSQDFRSPNTNNEASTASHDFGNVARKLSSAAQLFKDSTHSFSGDDDCPVSLHRFKQMVVAQCNLYAIPANNRVSLLPFSAMMATIDNAGQGSTFYVVPLDDKDEPNSSSLSDVCYILFMKIQLRSDPLLAAESNPVFTNSCISRDPYRVSVTAHDKLIRQKPFIGGLIDTGAKKTIIGLPQAVAYLQTFGINNPVKQARR